MPASAQAKRVPTMVELSETAYSAATCSRSTCCAVCASGAALARGVRLKPGMQAEYRSQAGRGRYRNSLMSCARERTPNISSRVDTWFFTVPSLKWACSAISRFDWPERIQSSISAWRAVRRTLPP